MRVHVISQCIYIHEILFGYSCVFMECYQCNISMYIFMRVHVISQCIYIHEILFMRVHGMLSM